MVGHVEAGGDHLSFNLDGNRELQESTVLIVILLRNLGYCVDVMYLC